MCFSLLNYRVKCKTSFTCDLFLITSSTMKTPYLWTNFRLLMLSNNGTRKRNSFTMLSRELKHFFVNSFDNKRMIYSWRLLVCLIVHMSHLKTSHKWRLFQNLIFCDLPQLNAFLALFRGSISAETIWDSFKYQPPSSFHLIVKKKNDFSLLSLWLLILIPLILLELLISI